MERETGFEPATSTLARSHSTTELFPPNLELRYHRATQRFKNTDNYHRSAVKALRMISTTGAAPRGARTLTTSKRTGRCWHRWVAR